MDTRSTTRRNDTVRRVRWLGVLAGLTVAVGAWTPGAAAPADGEVAWMRVFGTAASEGASAVGVSADGDVYVTGSTSGSLEGANAGGEDAFVLKYSADGDPEWIRQFGGPDTEYGRGLAVAADGSVYVTGFVENKNPEMPFRYLYGLFVRHYASDGSLLSAQEYDLRLGFAAPPAATTDVQGISAAVGADGSAYVVGWISFDAEPFATDVFVRKYAADGTLAWTQSLGLAEGALADAAVFRVAVSGARNVLVTGAAFREPEATNLDDVTASVRMYDADGALLWTQRFGSPDQWDQPTATAFDADGNVYVTGSTGGDLDTPNSGGLDSFVRRYDADGTLVWAQQFGTANDDFATAAAVADDGTVYVTWNTAIDGKNDSAISKFAADGAPMWTHHFGFSDKEDAATGVAIDTDRSVHVIGYVEGDPPSGGIQYDVYVRKYVSENPPPATSTTTSPATTLPSGPPPSDSSHSNTMLWVALGIVATLGVGGGLLLIAHRRRRAGSEAI